jgi:hypothetical protein
MTALPTKSENIVRMVISSLDELMPLLVSVDGF